MRAAGLALPLLALLLAAGCAALERAGGDWREARRDASGQAPDAAATREAVLQVYAARLAVRVNRAGPDNHWFGSRPDLLVDLRGEGVDALIARVEAAVAAYPYPAEYRTWPGPNSHTFTAHTGREVPELKPDLPPTAIGKDYLANGVPVARSPGGAGVQLSLWGLAGLLIGWEEGIEVNLLGFTFGVDVKEPALKLPLVGRVGHP
ncbi:MAG: DUF3750 domain-containing protein [Candidatus Rokubacteria bacterium]|nr:DUF3750 domain-containing protein [Candidatus Rokubacteria bacterium]